MFSVWLGGVGDWLAPWLSLRAAGFGGFVARPLLGILVALVSSYEGSNYRG